MRHTRILKTRLPVWMFLALLTVSFLLTSLPSARAAGTTNTSSGSTFTSKGGPDDPDDGSGSTGGIPGPGITAVRPHTPQVGISGPSAPPAQGGIRGRDVTFPNGRLPGVWEMALRAFFQAFWLVR